MVTVVSTATFTKHFILKRDVFNVISFLKIKFNLEN